MQIVINISKDDFEEICMQARMVEDTGSLFGRIRKAIFHGTPLPEGAEILTKEAYSDLCMRASRVESEVQDAGSN
jgi:hypothetical protein